MNKIFIITAILRRINIWWKKPGYYSIVNGMQPIYETKEELMALLEEIKKESKDRNKTANDE